MARGNALRPPVFGGSKAVEEVNPSSQGHRLRESLDFMAMLDQVTEFGHLRSSHVEEDLAECGSPVFLTCAWLARWGPGERTSRAYAPVNAPANMTTSTHHLFCELSFLMPSRRVPLVLQWLSNELVVPSQSGMNFTSQYAHVRLSTCK